MGSSFADRHVVVTGWNGALGSAVTKELLRQGATLHLPTRGKEEVAAFEPASRARVHLANGVDPTDEDAVTAFYAALPALWASIHCIGGFAAAPLADTSAQDLQGLLQTNLGSPFLCTREAARRLRRETGQGGRIVSVAARSGVEPRTGSGMAAYTASKSALAGLTAALGEELAPEGILVNAVAPAVMDTPANRRAMPKADFAVWPRVEEVAAAILWLASAENTLVRGAVVPVYGRS